MPTKIPIEIREVKPTEMLPLDQYCPVKRPLDMLDILLEAVQYEDRLNHAGQSTITIPDMKYPEVKHSRTSAFAFCKEIVTLFIP